MEQTVRLRCHRCHTEIPAGNYSYCPDCGGILTAEYGQEYLRNVCRKIQEPPRGMWDLASVLPRVSEMNRVSFGEGGTPLRESRKYGNLFFKNEFLNPTGSFKDRAVSVCVSLAGEFGCRGIAVASSGNGGAATSLYGHASGMDTVIFVPEGTPPGKVAQAMAYGGKVIRVRGNFSKSYQAAMELARQKNYLNVTTTFLSPYGLEGYKTIAYELFAQLKAVPRFVFIPVGAGPILYAIYKGFSELKEAGRIKKIPGLICAQAAGCAPISEAFLEKRAVKACTDPHSIASAICDPLLGYEQDGDITVEAVRRSGGYAFCLPDKEMRAAGRTLAREEGLFCEVSSAAAYAAYLRMSREGLISEDDRCVCILTGHGLKDAAAYVTEEDQIPLIDTAAELRGE